MRVTRTLPVSAALLLLGGCYQGLGLDDPAGGVTQGASGADGGEAGDAGEGGDDDGDPEDPDGEEACATAAPAPVRELTRLEYDNTVADLLDTDLRPAESFVLDSKDGLFDSNAVRVVTHDLADQYLRAAEDLASDVDLQAIASCWPESGDQEAACAREFVTTFGRRAFRRPLRAEQVDRYVALYEAVRSDPDLALDFDGALRIVIEAMLQSPLFINHVEYGDPDRADESGNVPLDDYELASRLAYTLTASMPDDDLLDAAEAGELSQPAQLRAHAERLLADPRARTAIARFYGQWLDVARIANVSKSPTVFPEYDLELQASMQLETERFLDEVLWGEGDGTLAELLSADFTFVDNRLAAVYGIEGYEDVPAGELVRIEGLGERRGVLGQASFLASHATSEQSSPVHRGVYVRDRLMCQPIAPPEDFNPTLPESMPGETPPELVERHLSDPSCAGCHNYFDPIGLGFESYDGLGRHRTEYSADKPVDDRGEILGSDDGEIDGEFEGLNGLAQKLAGSRQVQECAAEQAAVFALGLPASQECVADEIATAFVENGGDLRSLMLDVVTSEAFRMRAADDSDVEGEGCS
jgi:hypothetical protein